MLWAFLSIQERGFPVLGSFEERTSKLSVHAQIGLLFIRTLYTLRRFFELCLDAPGLESLSSQLTGSRGIAAVGELRMPWSCESLVWMVVSSTSVAW